MDTPLQRRRHDRYPFLSQLRVQAPHSSTWLLARGLDVSVGGLSFVSPVRLQVGDKIRLGLSRLDQDDVIDAEVRYVIIERDGFVVGAQRHLE